MTAVFQRLVGTSVLLAIAAQVTSVAAQPFGSQTVPEISLAVQLDEADNVSRSHLERVERFLEAGGWDEAIEALRRVMDTSGEKMMQVDASDSASEFHRHVTLRDYSQMLLVGLHKTAPEALDVYRSRVDPLAERLYQQAVKDRDEAALIRIVDSYFASSWGDDALMKLGEVEFERGNFTQARAIWERISPVLRTLATDAGDLPVPPGLPPWLAFPDTDISLADLRARLVLASIMEGSTSRAEAELTALERLHPDAEGAIGGRHGRYVELLGDLLEDSKSWPATRVPAGWMTFAGNPTRAKTADQGVDIALRPIWTMSSLPLRVANDGRGDPVAEYERVGESQTGLLSYHPLIVGDTVLVCTGETIHDIHALDLHSGRSLWPQEADATDEVPIENIRLRLASDQTQHGVPRYTMTAHANMLFVKLGPYATTIPQSDRHDPVPPGHIVALDLRAQKKRLFEMRLTQEEWGTGWAFEGPPLVDGADIYIVMRRRDNMRAQIHVGCFRMKPNRAELRWEQWVASAETIGQGRAVEYTHNLLAMDQGVLYVNTNQGAVAALRAVDGKILWLTRYPRAALYDGDIRRPTQHSFRDLNPCLVQKDIVVVAPQDCDRIFALDAATGMLRWQTESQQAVDVIHLLGIADGQLIASGHRLYWIDICSGRIASRFPARVQEDLRGYGRGIIAGGSVYWPTRDEIYVFDARAMRMTRQPINLKAIGMNGGNLLVADGVLLIAGADKLAAFNAYGRQVPPAEIRIPESDLGSGN